MTPMEANLEIQDAALRLLHSAASQFGRVAAAAATGDVSRELLEARQYQLQVAACAYAEAAGADGSLDTPLSAHADLLPPELSASVRGRVLRLARKLSALDAIELVDVVGTVEDETLALALSQEAQVWRQVLHHVPGYADVLESVRAHVDGFDEVTDCTRCLVAAEPLPAPVVLLPEDGDPGTLPLA